MFRGYCGSLAEPRPISDEDLRKDTLVGLMNLKRIDEHYERCRGLKAQKDWSVQYVANEFLLSLKRSKRRLLEARVFLAESLMGPDPTMF